MIASLICLLTVLWVHPIAFVVEAKEWQPIIQRIDQLTEGSWDASDSGRVFPMRSDLIAFQASTFDSILTGDELDTLGLSSDEPFTFILLRIENNSETDIYPGLWEYILVDTDGNTIKAPTMHEVAKADLEQIKATGEPYGFNPYRVLALDPLSAMLGSGAREYVTLAFPTTREIKQINIRGSTYISILPFKRN